MSTSAEYREVNDDPNTQRPLGHEENAMSNPWIVRTLVSSVAILVPLSVSAQDAPDYRCVLQDLERRVEVVYENGTSVPCEVRYFKDSEAPGEQQVLWNAQNESGYCESHAQAFIEKLEGWGWECNTVASADAIGNRENLARVTETEAGV